MPIRNILSDMEGTNLQKREKMLVWTPRWLVSTAWNLECILNRKGYGGLAPTSSWVSCGKSSPEMENHSDPWSPWVLGVTEAVAEQHLHTARRKNRVSGSRVCMTNESAVKWGGRDQGNLGTPQPQG